MATLILVDFLFMKNGSAVSGVLTQEALPDHSLLLAGALRFLLSIFKFIIFIASVGLQLSVARRNKDGSVL